MPSKYSTRYAVRHVETYAVRKGSNGVCSFLFYKSFGSCCWIREATDPFFFPLPMILSCHVHLTVEYDIFWLTAESSDAGTITDTINTSDHLKPFVGFSYLFFICATWVTAFSHPLLLVNLVESIQDIIVLFWFHSSCLLIIMFPYHFWLGPFKLVLNKSYSIQ